MASNVELKEADCRPACWIVGSDMRQPAGFAVPPKRHNSLWANADYLQLAHAWNRGKSLDELCQLLQRQPSGIVAKLVMLGALGHGNMDPSYRSLKVLKPYITVRMYYVALHKFVTDKSRVQRPSDAFMQRYGHRAILAAEGEPAYGLEVLAAPQSYAAAPSRELGSILKVPRDEPDKPRNHGKPWSSEDIENLVRCWNHEYTLQALGDRLGRRTDAIIPKLLDLGAIKDSEKGYKVIRPQLLPVDVESYQRRRFGGILNRPPDPAKEIKPLMEFAASRLAVPYKLEDFSSAELRELMHDPVEDYRKQWLTIDFETAPVMYTSGRQTGKASMAEFYEALRHRGATVTGRFGSPNPSLQQLDREMTKAMAYAMAYGRTPTKPVTQGSTGIGSNNEPNNFNQLFEEAIMNDTTTKAIETKTFINGVDAATLTDEQIYQSIKTLENKIASYNAVGKKPKKLQNKIEELQKSIDDIVAYCDSRA